MSLDVADGADETLADVSAKPLELLGITSVVKLDTFTVLLDKEGSPFTDTLIFVLTDTDVVKRGTLPVTGVTGDGTKAKRIRRYFKPG